MDNYRAGKRSSISFGSFQRPMVNFSQNDLSYYSPRQMYAAQQPPVQQTPMAFYPCRYETAFPLYALDWSPEDYVAVGSYREDSYNKLQILHSSDVISWDKVGEAGTIFPVSKVQWCPNGISQQLATSSDSLRLWTFSDFVLEEQLNLSLQRYNKTNGNGSGSACAGNQGSTAALGQLPPVSSFHWNSTDPNLIISSSIDTTCTVWDLQSSNYVKTQLIAHDSEVFDVKFLTQSTQLFASCGGDGSVRVFDLRSLAHSTIIYEPASSTRSHSREHGTGIASENGRGSGSGSISGSGSGSAHGSGSAGSSADPGRNALLRLEPSPFDPNVVATFAQDSTSVLILDMRYPGAPVWTLDGHSAAVNQIQWHPSRHNVLISGGDDCQALVWDINTQQASSSAATASTASTRWNNGKTSAHSIEIPQQAYDDTNYEINNLVWRPEGDWFGCNMGRQFQAVRV
ncbi:LAME_0B05556g1_1 [Lachancea meyersii CBS 8951]|uniref:LAME_0B05556g1_1 n=1 Tax=Lachancea meyersii CBS 8951 TaxID=1266667 RepID=A0A1G4IVQ9_9SACH|nr:LAME_0B05556g1_1 [Lachancea meyersii CBS 8951]